MQSLPYLAHYSDSIRRQVSDLLADNKLGQVLGRRYSAEHEIRSDKALYDYTQALKSRFMKKSPPIARICFDDKLTLKHQALGLHSFVSRVQGQKLKAKHEIRIAGRLKQAPEPLLRMVVVHELAHLREKEHNKAFYQLCCHMEPDYHQLEFDLRLLLTAIDANQSPF
ncbi:MULTISPECIES: M48 metallopeptidase family protein [Shewanella]|uniref:M48 family metallopeptidase n=2 Tax=Shewanella TaxID=22 RepID=A0A975ALB6_9GAMM|nr:MULTISPECIES: YgjP-like metallopeptidase domain-containing protein [Shewanella]QSX31272.1 M48 family metallopeptidase [Shewanella cyperi]QSX38513.1 M48 family metallopeptidase [Shewanella sedimentimangrovi]QSX42057.1 M48 family metallopeptidase [Shewanella cyperi]